MFGNFGYNTKGENLPLDYVFILCTLCKSCVQWEKLPGKCYNFWSKGCKTSLRKYVEKKKVCRKCYKKKKKKEVEEGSVEV
jgi:hypothetical protein